jgi:hypothetical protein
MDVKIEGKNVQLLGDQMLNNGAAGSGSPANAATMGGLIQAPGPPVVTYGVNLTQIAKDCNKTVNEAAGYKLPSKPSGPECTKLGTHKHKCCRDAIDKADKKNVRAEQSFTKKGRPAPYPGEIRPDAIISDGVGRVTKVVDFKFNCNKEGKMSTSQFKRYQRAFKVRPEVIYFG